MRIDELYQRLNQLNFIETYQVAVKHFVSKTSPEEEENAYRVLKMYSDQGKIAEVVLDHAYMLRTDYADFAKLSLLGQQALLKILIAFAETSVEARQSEMYFAYYNDLNHLPHFIKRLPNNRLSDEVLPLAYLKTLSEEELQPYIFTVAEMNAFPADYRPRFDPDSFVKVVPHTEMLDRIHNIGEEKE